MIFNNVNCLCISITNKLVSIYIVYIYNLNFKLEATISDFSLPDLLGNIKIHKKHLVYIVKCLYNMYLYKGSYKSIPSVCFTCLKIKPELRLPEGVVG